MCVSVCVCLCVSLCVCGVHKAEQELQCPVFEEGCAALPPTSSENKGVRGQGTLLEKRKTPKNRFTQENRKIIDCRRFSVPKYRDLPRLCVGTLSYLAIFSADVDLHDEGGDLNHGRIIMKAADRWQS